MGGASPPTRLGGRGDFEPAVAHAPLEVGDGVNPLLLADEVDVGLHRVSAILQVELEARRRRLGLGVNRDQAGNDIGWAIHVGSVELGVVDQLARTLRLDLDGLGLCAGDGQQSMRRSGGDKSGGHDGQVTGADSHGSKPFGFLAGHHCPRPTNALCTNA